MSIGEVLRRVRSYERTVERKRQEQAFFDWTLGNLIGSSVGRCLSNDIEYPKLHEAYPSIFNSKEVQEAEEEMRFKKIKEKAEKRKKELEHSGKCVEMLKEEPFLYAKDSIEYKIHLMIWNKDGKNRKVEVETYSEKE